MKTAISIPDPLNQNIEDFLKTTRMSRSEFFQRAARLYLDKAVATMVVDNLNRVYAEEEASDETAFHRGALAHLRELMGEECW